LNVSDHVQTSLFHFVILQSHSKKKEAHALAIEHHIPRLAKHSVAADTPEHYTSMTCSKWHSNRALQPGTPTGQHRSIAAVNPDTHECLNLQGGVVDKILKLRALKTTSSSEKINETGRYDAGE
jgi:hypothetical protein